ncbi:caspase, EACC1-associated type [Donghicola mangrovi]|uniref:SUMF1/EgtB/PvdO family nonheme iron enzyme n=1 Tax=Donghicola mangrovi TaxID=2729614 RepID=A0A850Q0L4_9RHOB|nr:SUMF1/EgtB/PvdO family nonheme iron enzyme [Donghicola mangrovi]NVO22626.1 SUMF1/EgtB/PvdO family nonheme iron enzyme [Donghicola mangrovi]
MARRLALLIGSRTFEDTRLAPLSAPWDDVETLGDVLRKYGEFEVDKQADLGLEDIQAAIQKLFQSAKKDDTVLLYYTGHGLRDTNGHDLYLALRRTKLNFIRGTSLKSAFIRDEMDYSPSQRQIVIFDCCHSGAFIDSGMTPKHGVKTLSESDVLNSGGTGRFVLAASAANESAYERDGRSIYTEFMVEALRTGAAAPDKEGVTVDDLHDYLVRRVGEDAVPMRPQLWKSAQNKPLMIARNPDPRKPLPPDVVDALFDTDVLRVRGAVAQLLRLCSGSDRRLAQDAERVLRERLNKTEDLLWEVAQEITSGLDQSTGSVRDAQISDEAVPKKPTATPEPDLTFDVSRKRRGAKLWLKLAASIGAASGVAVVNSALWQETKNTSISLNGASSSSEVQAIAAPAAKATDSEGQVTSDAVKTNLLPEPLSTFRDCTDCPDMIVIPGGTFTIGSPDTEKDRDGDEGPLTEIKVGPFALAHTEVTFDQWRACVQDGGCRTNPNPKRENCRAGSCPVINVSWDDAQEYIAWLNTHVPDEYLYRLPSEAQWEYAARATTVAGVPGPLVFENGMRTVRISSTAYPWGNEWDHEQTNSNMSAGSTTKVGQYTENGFGLSDMHGNVWEWMEDCYFYTYSSHEGNDAPRLAEDHSECLSRVTRGGSWLDSPRKLRSAKRNEIWPFGSDVNIGFRPARTPLPL